MKSADADAYREANPDVLVVEITPEVEALADKWLEERGILIP